MFWDGLKKTNKTKQEYSLNYKSYVNSLTSKVFFFFFFDQLTWRDFCLKIVKNNKIYMQHTLPIKYDDIYIHIIVDGTNLNLRKGRNSFD